MKKLSHSLGIMSRVICILLAIHFLNFSMDSKDTYPDAVPEDLSVNDIESISEFVAEILFGKTDAFAEYDEHDEDQSTVNTVKLFISCPEKATEIPFEKKLSRTYFIRDIRISSAFIQEISAPPPQC